MRQQDKGKTTHQGCELSPENPFLNPILFSWGKELHVVKNVGFAIQTLFGSECNYNYYKEAITRVLFELSVSEESALSNEKMKQAVFALRDLYDFISEIEKNTCIESLDKTLETQEQEALNLK